MKKEIKTILCSILVIALLVGSIPEYAINVKAATTTYTSGNYEYTLSGENEAAITRYLGSETKVIIPGKLDGNVVVKITGKLLAGNKNVKEVTVPETVTQMDNAGNGTFQGSEVEKVTFENGLTRLPAYALRGSKKLVEVSLPDTVTEIGRYAFWNCELLSNIELPKAVKTIGAGAFCGSGLENLRLPEEIEKIEGKILSGNTKVKEVTVPRTVTQMDNAGEGVFQGSEVEKVTFENGLTRLPAYALRGSKKLVEVSLPDTVTEIGRYAFWDCELLSNIELPKAVKTIGAGAFCNSGLESLRLPKEIEKIEGKILSGNTKVKEVTVPRTVTQMDNAGEGAFQGSGVEKVVFESGLTRLPSYALRGSKKLVEVSLPDTVTEIGRYAFWDCELLSNIELPKAVKTIGAGAFCGSGLENLRLPEEIEKIEGKILSGNTKVKEVTVPRTVTQMDNAGEGVFQGSGVEKVVFESGLTRLPAYALRGSKKLVEVSLPDTVTEIGRYAFWDCELLSNIKLPEAVKTIGAGAFCNSGLESLRLPGEIEKIEGGILRGNTKVKEVIVPETIMQMDNVGEGVFQGSAVEKVVFEKGLTRLPAYALRGSKKLVEVSLPDTVTEIGNSAFADCPNLTSLTIPNNMMIFGNNIFQNSPNVLAFCHYFCNGVIVCVDNEINFAPSDEKFQDNENKMLDRKKSMYFANMDSVSSNGYLPFSISFDVKSKWKNELSGQKIVTYIPKYTELVEESIKLNGNLVTDYFFNENTRKLTIPVNKDSGNITYSIKIKSKENVATYAYFTANKEGKNEIENIGAINEAFEGITINASDTVNSVNVDVSGIAPATTDIDLYVDGKKQTTVTSLKNGSWSATVSLDHPVEYYTYMITAKCVDEYDADIETSTSVSYKTSAPEVTSLVMEYNEHNEIKKCDMMNTNGTVPRIYYLPNSEFAFKVGFENKDNLDKVFVTSTRNNEKKSLEAVYDEKSGLYVTSGYFDEENTSYVPGTICVEYTEKQKDVVVSKDFDMQEYKSLLGEELQNSNVTYSKQTSEEIKANVDVSAMFEDIGDAGVDVSVKYVDVKAGTSIEDTLDLIGIGFDGMSYIVPGIDDEKYIYKIDWSDKENLLMVAYDASRAADKIMSVKLNMTDVLANEYTKLFDNAEKISNISKVLGFAYNTYGIYKDYDELVAEINKSCTITDKQAALKKAKELREDQIAFLVLTTVLPLLVAPELGVAAVAYSGLIAVMSAVSGTFFDMRVAQIKGEPFKLNWVIDPSGYVLDQQSKEVIGNAQMTAYWIPYDETDDFWDRKPKETEYGTVWNALEYEQTNPLLTNADGKYAWDVPEGWWRVKCEADGYITQWSEWMTVPPVQTEVNFLMVKEGKQGNEPVVPSDGPSPTPVCPSESPNVSSVPGQGSGANSGNTVAGSTNTEIRSRVTALPGNQYKKPGKVILKKAKAIGKGKVRTSWKKIGQSDGYQLQYAMNRSFTKKKKTKNKNYLTRTATIKNLKKGKVYYFRVRAYRLNRTKRIYGKWSAVKKVRIKK